MKILSLTLTLLIGLALSGFAAENAAKKPAKKGTVYHLVSFKFKEDASPEKIAAVEKAFSELPKKIKEIKSYDWGTNVSPEKHAKGFTHGFVLTFKNEKDRDTYLTHPDHQAFGSLVGPVLADVFVIDFISTK